MAKQGLVVCFDGADGVGKTTQLKLAADSLKADGYKVFTVKAVGGLPLTNVLGEALMMRAARPPETDLHIAMASQYALAEEIKTHLDLGEIVLIDRSPLAILAYQVYGDGLNKEAGLEAATELLTIIQPDLILVYETSVDVAHQRLQQRNGQNQRDHFESKPVSYQAKVQDGYRFAAKQFGAELINADAPIELVREATMQLIGAKLKA